MDDLLSLDVENPSRYLLTVIIVWVGVASIIQVLFEGELTDAVIIGVFGGFAFGAASLFLGQINGS